MAVQLFAHNRQAYNAAVDMLNRTAKAAVIHPTGTGKSFIAFKWVEEHADERFVWLSPSEYIYKTQVENVTRSDADYPAGRITFLTYARLMMMTDEEIAELTPYGIVLDEFHRCGAKCWGGGVARLLSTYPQARLLGLSATKVRYLDGQRDMAEELFAGCVASEMSLGEAIVRGILPSPTYVTTVYQIQRALDGIQKRVDAVSPAALRRDGQRHMDALREAVQNAEGLPSIFTRYITDKTGKYLVFCASQAHMKRVLVHAKEWFAAIDEDMHIYSAYSADPETSRAYKAFVRDDSQHLKLLFSINMLNEGVHVRGVSGVILFRQTVSPIIYKQQIGRALTTGMQSTPLILDVVNNFDSLSSYGTIQQEMDEAVHALRSEGRGDEICAEKLVVIEQVKDAAALFKRLESSLSTTWDFYFEAAASYFKVHKNLRIRRRYVTEDGLSLGLWIQRQRGLYRGHQLSQGQIERLSSIGMVWEDKQEFAWQEGYRHAEEFFRQNGHLNVENSYVCEDGYALGAWIRRMRQQKNGSVKRTLLTPDRIAALEAIGMTWSVYSEGWANGYEEAKHFYEVNGHLDVPGGYVTESGFTLGSWIAAQRQARMGQYGRTPLTKEQRARLDSIGMLWETRKERTWQRAYEAAKTYYAQNGNLCMPVRYETPDGIRLGEWVFRQRQCWKNGGHTDAKRYEKLREIGLFSSKPAAKQARRGTETEERVAHGGA